MHINVRGRSRVAAGLALSMAVLGATAAINSSPAVSAEPAGDCTPAYPMTSLEADLAASPDGTIPVTAKTVTRGTVPTTFTGDVIGVLDDGIAPGLDMVLARMDVSAMNVPDVSGIWYGMSGSPVYTEGGDLIGAIAYGLAWGESNIAGITPFEEMDNYLPAAPAATVKVSDKMARTIAANSDVTQEQASEGLTQLRIPKKIAGLSSARIENLQDRKKFQNNDYLVKKLAGAGGNAAPDAADVDDLVAGGNLAAAASYGDITFGGVGTATSVCDGRVVAFGHPAYFMGDTTLTLHPADAIYIQDDPMGSPFKIANLAAPVGTITGDHLSGISGTFGALPPSTVVESTVTYADRERTGSSSVSVKDATPSVVFYQSLVNHDRVIDAIQPGSETQSFTITGLDEAGEPFTLSATDRYMSEYDIAFAGIWEVADLVWILSGFEDVVIDDVSVHSAVDDSTDYWRVRQLQQKRDGEWVKISRRNPAVVQAGKSLVLQAVLEGEGDATTTVPLSMDVPARAAGHRGYLNVEGGAWNYNNIYGADSVDDLEQALANSVSNDQVVANLFIDGRNSIERTDVSDATDRVVFGNKFAYVKIK